MDLKYRLFPYPILGEYYDDYKNTSFTDTINYEINGNKLSFKAKFETDNEEIKELINNDKLIYAIHVECAQTSYRKMMKTKENSISFDIKDSEVIDKIEISTFIIVNKEIKKYKNIDFNDDYLGTNFDLKPGNIIGVGSQWKIEVDKSKDELGKLPSIFSILMKKDNDREFSINLLDDKINILLSEKDYLNYKRIADNILLEPVFHSTIVLPALIYVFEELSKGDISEFEEYRWFKGLRKSLAKYNILLDDETIRIEGSVKLAQKILDMPLERALEGLLKDEDDEEEV
ncbi:MAG: hypothetical protein PHQ64_04405 [Bacilli bacterium]|nr:hypothetical protein [Bacilli bacterium]